MKPMKFVQNAIAVVVLVCLGMNLLELAAIVALVWLFSLIFGSQIEAKINELYSSLAGG